MMTRYTRLGASSRLRMLQYRPGLERAGLAVTHAPFFDDGHLDGLYAGSGPRLGPARALGRRLRDLRAQPRPGVIWLEYEALPWAPWPVERMLWPSGVPIVADYDDAIFHRYDLHRQPLIRGLLGRKIDFVMASARLVTAGNPYLAERARTAGARRVEIVPTVVDLKAYGVGDRTGHRATPIVGWIGSPSTWRAYMAPFLPLLIRTAEANGAQLRVVGADRTAAHPLLDSLPWSEDTEVSQIQSMDIGIMPLTDTPWARGKCGYKLIQYMACGLPVVASPVGVNAEIVEHGVNGFLASTEADWHAALTTLLTDPALRQRMGAAGRRKVEAQYSLQVWGPRVAALLRSAAG